MNIHFHSDFPLTMNPGYMYWAALKIPGVHVTRAEDADVVINVDSIHKTGLKRGKITVYYEHDDMLHRGRNTQFYDVDLLYCTSPHALPFYPDGTKNLLAAFDPDLHYRWMDEPIMYELGFIGQERDIPLYEYRRQVLDVLEKNFNLLRTMCQPQDYFKFLSRAIMPVNILPTEGSMPLINMRFYESLNVGCTLNNYHPCLDDVAEEGVHYVGFESPEEAIEKAKYYLSHPEEKEKIFKTGQAHVLANHTWTHRIKQILNDVEKLK